MMLVLCSNCGASVRAVGANFCSNCGAVLPAPAPNGGSATSVRKRKPKGQGSLFQRKADGLWYYSVVHNGIALKKCLGSFPSEAAAWTEAEIVKAGFLNRIAIGELEASTSLTVTVGELLDNYIEHLNTSGAKYAYIISCCVNATLRPCFGDRRVASLKTTDLERFRQERERQGRSSKTINNDLSYLRSALLFESNGTAPRIRRGDIPDFPMVKKVHIRSGFIEYLEYERILVKIPPSLKCLFVVAYHVGISKSELLRLKLADIDFANREVTLRGENGRQLPIYADMEKWLRKQLRTATRFPDALDLFFWFAEDVQLRHGGFRLIPGSSIRRFEASWNKAVAEAGHPGLRLHDLRRSALRNMVAAGIPEVKALEISGYRTNHVLTRHKIFPATELHDLTRKMDKWVTTKRPD
jgi:integrase